MWCLYSEVYAESAITHHQEKLNIIDKMSLTKPIPKKMREEMTDDTFMNLCCIQDSTHHGRIQWHHHLKFAGKRVNEKWCILPVCELHHRLEAKYKQQLDAVMVSRATYEELSKYSKAIDYCKLKKHYE